jgi:hypothetical protein
MSVMVPVVRTFDSDVDSDQDLIVQSRDHLTGYRDVLGRELQAAQATKQKISKEYLIN